jgi:hypothetical protein
MLIKAQMVPLPVSAVEKLREAKYFYNQMVKTRTNVYTFPYNFSAFLSSLRSVTFYLQQQYNNLEHFQEWYNKKQAEIRSDPLLRMLKAMRDEALHAKPIELCFLHGPALPEEGVTTNHFEVTTWTDNQGEINIKMKIGIEGKEEDAEPVVKWVVELPEEIDILEACYEGFHKIQRLVLEWSTQHDKSA